MNKEVYYLVDYIEDFDGELEDVVLVDEFEIGDEKYSILKREDGVEFVVLGYNSEDEYIWVSGDKDDDWVECLGV